MPKLRRSGACAPSASETCVAACVKMQPVSLDLDGAVSLALDMNPVDLTGLLVLPADSISLPAQTLEESL